MTGASAAFLALLVVVSVAASRSLSEQAAAVSQSRISVYASAIAHQWVLAGAAWLIVLHDGQSPADIGIGMATQVGATVVIGLVVTACVCATALGVRWLQHRLRWAETDVLLAMLPETTPEKIMFLVVALTAGVCEEVLFRGFAITRFASLTGDMWSGAMIAVALFTVGHSYQGVAGLLRAGSMGVVLSIPYLLTGNLAPGMLAHFLYDTIAGIWGREWLKTAE